MSFKTKDFGFVNDLKRKVETQNTKSYNAWTGIIKRCYNKNSEHYKYYGAKGVTVCEEWKIFSNFKKWYDENYKEGCQIDKDIKGGKVYSLENCVFVSKKDNFKECISRRNNDYLKATGFDSFRIRDLKYFEETPITRGSFKKSLKIRNMKFEDFEETVVFENPKKYTYKLIKK